MMPSIACANVSKSYKGIVAVSDVSFAIGPGVTALLGPNGAGKSTIMRMVCGLTKVENGTLHVLGGNPRNDKEVIKRIGIVPQQDSVFARLTALQFVTMAGELGGVADPIGEARRSLEAVEMDHTDKRSVESYSKGMKQRVKVAQALVTNPSVIVADEPLNGLDPRQRIRLIEIFKSLGEQGRTVLISSHVLDEVERFGSRVLVLAEGRLAAEGDFRQIRGLMDSRPHLIRVRSDKARLIGASLVSNEAVSGCRVTDHQTIELEVRNVDLFRSWIMPLSQHHDAIITEIAPLDDDLESVFRYLVGARVGGSQ